MLHNITLCLFRITTDFKNSLPHVIQAGNETEPNSCPLPAYTHRFQFYYMYSQQNLVTGPGQDTCALCKSQIFSVSRIKGSWIFASFWSNVWKLHSSLCMYPCLYFTDQHQRIVQGWILNWIANFLLSRVFDKIKLKCTISVHILHVAYLHRNSKQHDPTSKSQIKSIFWKITRTQNLLHEMRNDF